MNAAAESFAVLLSGRSLFATEQTPDGRVLRTWASEDRASAFAAKSGGRAMPLSEATLLIFKHGLNA